MIVRVPDADLCHRRHSNLPLLIGALARFRPDVITGYATLEQTPFLKNFRLKFVGVDEYADAVLEGPAFVPELLEIPELAPRLQEYIAEFIRQIVALEPEGYPI